MTEFINLKYNISVSREQVRLLLKDVDPIGVQERSKNVIKRRIYQTLGPNDVCHYAIWMVTINLKSGAFVFTEQLMDLAENCYG